METYRAIVSEIVYIKANNKKDAIKRIEKYYKKLGLNNIDIEIKKEG
jgi:hypothetical protein